MSKKEKDEIVQDVDVAVDLTDSKFTSDGMFCTFCFQRLQETHDSVTQ